MLENKTYRILYIQEKYKNNWFHKLVKNGSLTLTKNYI